MPGIDVSVWQGIIDWGKAASKVQFAFIKASEGLFVDAQFKRNWAESKKVGGVRRGAYLFYRFSVDPGQQARVMIDALAGDYGELPLVVDLEDTSVTGACSASQLGDLRWCLDILERFSGKRPVIYTAKWWADPHLGAPAWLSAYDLWVANYVTSPAIAPVMPAAWTPGAWKYFQWSNTGIGADYGVQSPTVDLDVAAGEIPVTPPSHPAPTFSASKLVISAGESVTLSWDAPGASGIYLDGAGVTGPANSRVVQPHPTGNVSTYTLRVTYPGEPGVTIPVTVTVIPTPAPLSKVQIGYNVLSNGNAARQAYSKGFRYFLVIDDKPTANWLAEQPGTTVLYRHYMQNVPSVDGMVAALDGLSPLAIGLGVNEHENMNGSDIRGCANFDIEVAKRWKARNPQNRYAAGSWSMGTPDYTKQQVCDDIATYYAPAYNSGLILWDCHLYSPTMDWIYKAPGVSGKSLLPILWEYHEEPVGRDGHVATWWTHREGPAFAEVSAAITHISRNLNGTVADDPTYQWWFESRWRFAFTRCKFDPTIKGVHCGEWQVDEGGVGGLLAHRATVDQAVAYVRRWYALQMEPLIVNGQSYPSPFCGGAIFQLGDTSTAQGHWGGYAIDTYLDAIATSGVLV